MKKRSIFLMIVFTIITCGIYMFYWYIAFQVELKRQTNEGFGGLGHFLMLLFTFGFYAIYWQYAAGKRLAKQGASDLSLVYILLVLVGCSLNPFIMQSQANSLK